MMTYLLQIEQGNDHRHTDRNIQDETDAASKLLMDTLIKQLPDLDQQKELKDLQSQSESLICFLGVPLLVGENPSAFFGEKSRHGSPIYVNCQTNEVYVLGGSCMIV